MLDFNHPTPTLDKRLDFFRKASLTAISALVDSIPELRTGLPQDYLRELDASDCMICLRGSLVCWAISKGKMVLREMQLCSIVADQQVQDSLVSAGTGSGKTLPIAICCYIPIPQVNSVSVSVCLVTFTQTQTVVHYFTKHMPPCSLQISLPVISCNNPSLSLPFTLAHLMSMDFITTPLYHMCSAFSKWPRMELLPR